MTSRCHAIKIHLQELNKIDQLKNKLHWKGDAQVGTLMACIVLSRTINNDNVFE